MMKTKNQLIVGLAFLVGAVAALLAFVFVILPNVFDIHFIGFAFR